MTSLPRRVRLGIGLDKSLTVQSVMPEGMGESAGLEPYDVLTSLGSSAIQSRADIERALRSLEEIQDAGVEIGFRRGDKTITKRVPVARAPLESGVTYGHAVCDDGVRLRTLLDVPADTSTRRPAIVFLQGLSLASMENAFADLCRAWQAEGFVAMRIERRGVGDSEGAAPVHNDFEREVNDFRAGVQSIFDHDFVDPKRVFLFGYSVGGMIAPKLTAGDLVAGYITYGSSAEPWFDCVEAGARRQGSMMGHAPEIIEERIAALRLEHRAEQPASAAIDGRPVRYHRQLHEARLDAAWRQVQGPVLSLYGEYDFVVSEDETRAIATLAPNGEHRKLAGLDHLMMAHDSLTESLKNYGRGRPDRERVARETSSFLRKLM